MTRLLINENPLQVLPTLAVKIGLNEAMILQQMHYWLNAEHNKNYIQGRHWVYNSYDEWHKQFPFWSKETIKRAIYSLEKQKLVVSDKLSEEKFNHRKWYSINYLELQRLDQENERSGQIVTNGEIPYETPDQVKMIQTDVSMCSEHNKEQRLPTEITAENYSSRGFDEKKIANDMKNIWIEEIGDEEVTHLTESLISNLNLSYQNIFTNSLGNWRTYCRKIASSKFLMGESGNKSFQRAWLSWAIKPDTFYKIEAGEYTFGDREILPLSSQEKEAIDYKQELINLGKHPLWVETSTLLIERVGDYAFQWLKEIDITYLDDRIVKLQATNKFTRDWVIKNLFNSIRETLELTLNHKIHYLTIESDNDIKFGTSFVPNVEEGEVIPSSLSSTTYFMKTGSHTNSEGKIIYA